MSRGLSGEANPVRQVDIDTLVDDDKEYSEELKAALNLVPPKRYTGNPLYPPRPLL